ncbi:MAG: transporter [Aquabacterium sp.]|jgi:hypothetical protein|uniref:SphA family protein n=1 Tax=Aquabacterium sp. TaxID=1872578 RepID=UPI001B5E96BB|nr:transporter [Aquabacterium sp.]MBP7131875.1 transporter [Aquabacterium sp.]MBP9062387.1 transporter [Aquabacterium sp.]MDQ5925148.1 hypothetical protein [Pseudomonadota bacterium]
MSRTSFSIDRTTLKASALVLALAAATSALAVENGNQRYSAGIGGSDMTTPVVPGLYVQAPMVAYHADKIKGNDGKQRQVLGSPINIDTNTYAVLPRLTYISGHRFLGAHVGVTAMMPIVKREAYLNTVDPLSPVASLVSAKNGSASGVADLEVSPVMHWEIGDHQSVTFAPTIVMPVGDFNKDRRANSGFGDYYTFRPSVQYAFIGDGWDLGGRAVMSFNTRNKDSGYYSGKIFNFDWQAMAFVSEDIRLGVQGYFVRQLQADTSTNGVDQFLIDQEKGAKASANAIGPAVAWLMNGGEMLVEGKFIKEFGSKNRTEGHAFWLTISKPL